MTEQVTYFNDLPKGIPKNNKPYGVAIKGAEEKAVYDKVVHDILMNYRYKGFIYLTTN